MLKERLKRLVTFIIALAILLTNINIASAATINKDNIPDLTLGFKNGADEPLNLIFSANPFANTHIILRFGLQDGSYLDIEPTLTSGYDNTGVISSNQYYLSTKVLESNLSNYFIALDDFKALSDINDIGFEYKPNYATGYEAFVLEFPYHNDASLNGTYNLGDSVNNEQCDYFSASTHSSGVDSSTHEQIWKISFSIDKLDEFLENMNLVDLSQIYDLTTNTTVQDGIVENFSINTQNRNSLIYNINYSKDMDIYKGGSASLGGLFLGSFNYQSDDLYIMQSDAGRFYGSVVIKFDIDANKFKFYLDTNELYESEGKLFSDKYAKISSVTDDDYLQVGSILDGNTYYGLKNIKYNYKYAWDYDIDDYNLTESTGIYTDIEHSIRVIRDGRPDCILGLYECIYGNYIFESDAKYKVNKIIFYEDAQETASGNYISLDILLTDVTEKVTFKDYFTNEIIKTVSLGAEELTVPEGYYDTWVDVNNITSISSEDILNTTTANTYIGIPMNYLIPVYSSSIKDASSSTGWKKLYEVEGTLSDEPQLTVAERTTWSGTTYLDYSFDNTVYNVTDITQHVSSYGITPHYFKGYGGTQTVLEDIFIDDGSNNGIANDGLVDDKKSVYVGASYSYGNFYGNSVDEIYEIDNTSLVEPCTTNSYIKCNPVSQLIETNSLDLDVLDSILDDYSPYPDEGEFDITLKENTDIIIEIDKLQEASSLDIDKIKAYYFGYSSPINLSDLKSTPIEEIRNNPNYVFEDEAHNELNVSATLGLNTSGNDCIEYFLYYSSDNRPDSSNYLLFRGCNGFDYTLFTDEINTIAGHDFTNATYSAITTPSTQDELDALINGAVNKNDLGTIDLSRVVKIEKAECKRNSDLCTNPKAYKLKIELSCLHENTNTNRDNIIPAKCTEDGSYDEVVTCNDCQAEISRTNKKIDKLGHDWSGTWQTVNNPTQELFNNAVNHDDYNYSSLGEYDTVEKLDCKRENDICTNPHAYKIRVTTHQHTNNDGAKENEVPATCTQDGSYNWVVRCTICGDIISSDARIAEKTGHNFSNATWQNISTATDINALIAGAENSALIQNEWINDNYHRLQVQYCTNIWDCVRGSSEKAYRLRVLRFEFKYDEDNNNDGKPDVTIDVIEEPKEDGEQERKIDEIDTTVEERPIVNPIDPEIDDPYVPYIVTPEDNPYDYDYKEERDYRIPTATITVATNYWKTFLNTITFDIFFKDTQTGTISYEFKNPSEWDKVKSTSYVVSKQGVTYNDSEIKNVDTWTDGTSFTLTKEDVQKYVAYAKIRLAGGYEFYISSDGMIMDSVSPTITGQTEEDVILFSEEKFTIEDNTKLDKVFVDGEEVTIVLNDNENKTEIAIENDGQTHTIKAIDKAGNEVEKTIKFDTSDFIATIEGYIKDIDGKPVANAKVELRSTPRTTTTDENGKFTFTNVEVDRHTLKAFVNDNKIYEMSLALTPTYVKTELTDVQGTYTVSSDFTADSTSLVVRVDANECENHVHGHEEKENEVNPTCTKSGGYDLVDYCPNCGCEYKRTYTFIDALGHIWEDSDWVLVDEKDITDDLLKNAENLIDKKDITNKHKLYKRLCHRALDAYELKLVESTDTETKPEKTPENKPEETPENKPENTQPPKTEEIPTPSEDNTSIDSENNKQEDIPEDVETVDIEEDEAEEEDKSGSQKLPDEKSENKAVSKNPKTGDINIYIYLIMIAVGFGILIFATRKKKNN